MKIEDTRSVHFIAAREGLLFDLHMEIRSAVDFVLCLLKPYVQLGI